MGTTDKQEVGVVRAELGWAPEVVTPDQADAPATTAGLERAIAEMDVAARLTEAKALIFRGFGLTVEGLDAVMDRLLPDRLAYVHGNSPRSKVGRNLYTSTEYPASQSISLHNELSYLPRWPGRLLFFCQTAPGAGGATPLADSADWLAALDPEVRGAFEAGIRYAQNLHGGVGLGKSWQDTFESADRDLVEAYLADSGMTWSWLADGGLRVSHRRPATARHPETGAEVWFNQADQWHPAGLGTAAGAALARLLPAEQLPQSAAFGDGSSIPDEYIAHIQEVGWRAAVDVEWRAGDLLLIDNMLVAHGRRPFTGPRRVLVAMSG
jgi:alpha-ketoglutarate-dependent taurine dioxygenase